ncbi:hypothetical protein COT72_03940 [archaeon CG10_big_fil_rev_8_21_14_0_10_43_11]|nr:MAG: hypothetical protein COT72_03940 [archaeon CG10_big_fil_rev_8_21_14_0_10_43_11]
MNNQLHETICKFSEVNKEYSPDEVTQKFFPQTVFPSAKLRIKVIQKYSRERSFLLDAGCGTGWVSSELSKNRKIISLDLSDSALGEAKMLKTFTKSTNTLVKADVQKIPIKNKSIDTIFSFSMIEHIPNVNNALGEFKRILKKDGKIIILVPNKYGAYCVLYDILMNRGGQHNYGNIRTDHENLQGFSAWKNVFEENNLKLLETLNTEFLTPFIAYIFKRSNKQQKSTKTLRKIDSFIAKFVPKHIASAWIFILEERK